MAMSPETGRGLVSNTSGKPMTAASTSTTEPIKRWRARRRMTSTLSGLAGAALTPLGFLPAGGAEAFAPPWRNLKKLMSLFWGP